MSDDFKNYVADIYRFANPNELSFPTRIVKTKIYDRKPLACEETFLHSMYLEPRPDYIDTVVLYAPNMELLQVVDNLSSPATISYKQAISKGFTFAMTQSVTAGVAFEAQFAIAKTTFSFELTLSFSESWTTTVTEEKACSVPPYSRVFFYQGIMSASVMRYETETFKFYYMPNDEGKYKANILKATEKAIT